jgi:hypothetical protein
MDADFPVSTRSGIWFFGLGPGRIDPDQGTGRGFEGWNPAKYYLSGSRRKMAFCSGFHSAFWRIMTSGFWRVREKWYNRGF